MTLRPLITIGLSSHRLEVLPFAFAAMERHQAVVLEEAPEPDLAALLAGEKPVDDYLAEKDVEFPLYSREQLAGLQRLHRQGAAVLQVEPYLERLLAIHELLAAGVPREEVEARPGLREVYAAESRATRALLQFYRVAHTASFPEVVAAVKAFARTDAHRFRLRDGLRARELASLAGRFASLFVEAGYIHLYLVRSLKRLLRGTARIRPVFLLAGRALPEIGRPRPLGPGDLLTLNYIFGREIPPAQEDLLAARSLIHIQLLSKAELAPGDDPAPHLTDEIAAWRLTAGLAMEDCRRLYPKVRRLSPAQAVSAVRGYLAGSGGG